MTLPEEGRQAELRPCPFCGGEAYFHSIGNEHTKSRGTEIGCSDNLWRADMRGRGSCGFKKRVMAIRQTREWTQERAIAAWNRRTGGEG